MRPHLPVLKFSSALATAALAGSLGVTATSIAAAPAAQATERTASAWARDAAADLAVTRVSRTPYRYGGTSLYTGADCSGFSKAVFANKGVSLARTANDQRLSMRAISRAWLRRGDFIFFNSGGRTYHMGIYVGDGYMVDAPGSGRYVTKRKPWTTSGVTYGTLRPR
ncbi:C40 family peptidase [Janibacter sp. G56]|uniref:C40 family peptidase n=1 Tax=Janibacter sp. G56 TaxID=3418717 RepID=UPI003CFDADF7